MLKLPSKRIIPDFIIILFGVLETLKYILLLPVMAVNAIGVIIGSFCILWVWISHPHEEHLIPAGVLAIFTFFGMISISYNGNMQSRELLWPLFYMGIALMILDKEIDNFAAAIPVYFFSAVMIYQMLIAPIYTQTFSESRNYCSVYALCFYCNYIIVRYKNGNQDVPILALFLSSFCSFLSFGRGATLTFLLSKRDLARTGTC